MEKDKGRGSVQVGGCGVLVIHFFGVYAPLVTMSYTENQSQLRMKCNMWG